LAKVLVTGATGFIGAHVARLTLERGHDVRLAVEEGSPDGATCATAAPYVVP
jgi:uncharacterized protein YbjT (DUF2867 family)